MQWQPDLNLRLLCSIQATLDEALQRLKQRGTWKVWRWSEDVSSMVRGGGGGQHARCATQTITEAQDLIREVWPHKDQQQL